MPLLWSAWNNGKHSLSGAGYGIKVPIGDRDRYFNRNQESVILELPVRGGFVKVTLNTNKSSFWNKTCHELISQEIGRWLLNAGLAQWPTRHPPKLAIGITSEKHFRVMDVIK